MNVTLFSQQRGVRLAEFQVTSGCTLESLFINLSSFCNAVKKVCSPAFILIEDTFYCYENDKSLSQKCEILYNKAKQNYADQRGFVSISTEQNRGATTKFRHENASEVILRDVNFRIGYPYLLRHSAKDWSDENNFSSGESLEIGCCDHVFMFNNLRLAHQIHDKSLLDAAKCSGGEGIILVQNNFATQRRRNCEICVGNSAFAIVVQSSKLLVDDVGLGGDQSNSAVRVSQQTVKEVREARYICTDCYEMFLKDLPHKIFPYMTDTS